MKKTDRVLLAAGLAKRWTKQDTLELIVSIVVSVVTSVIVCLKVRCGC